MLAVRSHQPNERASIEAVRLRLSELLDSHALDVGHAQPSTRETYAPDALFECRSFRFVVEWRSRGDLPSVATLAGLRATAERLRQATASTIGWQIPLFAAPFVGSSARAELASAGVSWLDLSGNACIRAPGLFVSVTGNPNAFPARGRPSSAFAPRSSRVARHLLINFPDEWTQTGLTEATGPNKSQVSRTVRRLIASGLAEVTAGGKLRAPNSALLLDAWAEVYDFQAHRVQWLHMPVRDSAEGVRMLCKSLREAGVRHAVTGLAAAWLQDGFASFRTMTVYIDGLIPGRLLDSHSIRAAAQGANLWLVTPNDSGVFNGAKEAAGCQCVHPVQTWLDLRGNPERSKEAADHLRQHLLGWGRDA